ncbi:ROK family transcriptional regulator [Saccharopolyspora gloriosae]|uniref:Putative NBD/HSP70 family sugar kinase n=1 Tax=Saccharopolyspora gloriosae TaxID=455344 RepID=A0A840NBM5_9PSEU|nr:ROK family transcriptional regulator [Saccharopolyspora gloriosae]MBB5069004.1 putative NBD/HSP70 family sugar kinase [Saccharopolyspora gloriosae]
MRGSNLDRVRRGNLATVLGLVHRGGALSRAEITRTTGLSRSTVAALIAELTDLGFVLESGPGATAKVGRPSPLVHPDPGCVAITVNPELDAVTVGVVSLGGKVRTRVRNEVGHPVTAAETVEIVVGDLADLAPELASSRVAGIGVAVPGLVREGDGVVRWAPHLGWREEPIAAALHRATGHAAFAANDASLGALAEHIFGAGVGVRDLVYLNGGASGIGGGVITGGAPLGGVGGYAGEFGRTRPGVRDPADRAVADGTLEDEVGRARLLALLGLDSADQVELSAALAASADRAVRAELARQARVLSVAVSNAVNVLDPEMVVLGGFLADVLRADPEGFTGLVRDQSVGPASEGVRIVPAALGADLLMIGAGQLALHRLLADPAAIRDRSGVNGPPAPDRGA